MNAKEFCFNLLKVRKVKIKAEIININEMSRFWNENWKIIPRTKKVVRKINGDLYKLNWICVYFYVYLRVKINVLFKIVYIK